MNKKVHELMMDLKTLSKKYLLSLALVFMVSAVFAQKDAISTIGDGAALPEFAFQGTDGNGFLKSDLAPKQSVIVFYFDPDCDHCQKEAGWINEQRAKFKNISLLWVSWGEMDEIRKFKGKYMPDLVSACHMTKDIKFKFDDYFGYSEIPSIYVYKYDVKGWTRTASFKKEIEPDILLKFAQ